MQEGCRKDGATEKYHKRRRQTSAEKCVADYSRY